MMPTFDRAAAKAAGWTDQEIEAAIVAGPPTGMAGTRGAPRETPSAPLEGYTGAPDAPLEDPGLMDPMNWPGMVTGAGAALGLGRAALPAVGRTVLGTGRAVGRRVLGKGNFDDLLREITGAAPKAKAAAPAPAGKVVGKITPKGAVKGTAESRVKAAAKPKPKPAPKPKAKGPTTGTAESRVKTYRPRGSSTPELERRAAARAAATGKNPPAMADDLEAQLTRSVQVEDQMNALGLDELQKQSVRFALRQQRTPDELSHFLTLLGGIGP